MGDRVRSAAATYAAQGLRVNAVAPGMTETPMTAGMLKMREAGAYNFSQDEASCVVFGMPKEAIKLGGVDQVIALDDIPNVLMSWR